MTADAPAGSDAYRLADLQAYLTRWPPEHYSSQGREPLLYAIVLLLTLQPRTAVAFLARHASAASFRVDSVHLAMALVHHQVLPSLCWVMPYPALQLDLLLQHMLACMIMRHTL